MARRIYRGSDTHLSGNAAASAAGEGVLSLCSLSSKSMPGETDDEISAESKIFPMFQPLFMNK